MKLGVCARRLVGMIKRFLVRSLVCALSIWLCVSVLPGVGFVPLTLPELRHPFEMVVSFVLMGAIFALVNAIIRPLVVLIALPFYVVTLGLFSVVVNGIVVLISANLADSFHFGLQLDSFWWAIGAGIVIGILNSILEGFLPHEYSGS